MTPPHETGETSPPGRRLKRRTWPARAGGWHLARRTRAVLPPRRRARREPVRARALELLARGLRRTGPVPGEELRRDRARRPARSGRPAPGPVRGHHVRRWIPRQLRSGLPDLEAPRGRGDLLRHHAFPRPPAAP